METSLHNQSKPLLLPPAPLTAMSDHHHISAVEVNGRPPAETRAGDSDETDYSTSFADTTSTDQSNPGTISDAEVESQFSSPFDDFGTVLRFRKKRLTSHWRSFIRPLMWRCKWAELKLKQFESQSLKYAKRIAARDRTKHLGPNQSIPEGFSSKSMPYNTSQRRRRKLMKRRKRVKVEETTDADLYMSQHYLFSYHESMKSDPDEVMDDFDDPEQNTTNQETVDLSIFNNSSFLEDDDNEMEHILYKIEAEHSRVQKLKSQLDLVISENSQMFYSENLNPCEEQMSAINSPNFSNPEFDIENLEYAVSNYEEGFHIPDIIESTVGILSSVDVTQHQSHIGDSCENILDNILVHDETTEAEKHTLKNCQQQQQVIIKQEAIKSEEQEQEQESTHLDPTMDSDTATKSTLKSCFNSDFQIPKNKRKRGERKAGPGNWNLQVPKNEPDS